MNKLSKFFRTIITAILLGVSTSIGKPSVLPEKKDNKKIESKK